MNIRFDVCKYVSKHYISFNMGPARKMGVASNRCTARRNRTTINTDKDQRVYIGRLVVGHIFDGLLGISPGIWFSRYQMIISWEAQVWLKKSTPESMVSWFISTSPIHCGFVEESRVFDKPLLSGQVEEYLIYLAEDTMGLQRLAECLCQRRCLRRSSSNRWNLHPCPFFLVGLSGR